MATSETTNLQLVKYGAGTDNFIRMDYNGNLDKIDTFAGNTNQAITTLGNTDCRGTIGADLSSYSTLADVITAVEANDAKCGYASTGTNDSNNFRTLVGESGLSANDRTQVKKIAPNIYICIATSLSAATGLKIKFIRNAGWNPTDSTRMSQTQWYTYN